MARLDDRRFSIVVADSSGKGLDLAKLRCRFVARSAEINPMIGGVVGAMPFRLSTIR